MTTQNNIKFSWPSFWQIFKNAIKYLRSFWFLWTILLLLGFALRGLGLAGSYLTKPLIDIAYGQKNWLVFIIISAIGVFLFLFSKVIGIASNFLSQKLNNRLTFKINADFLNHFFKLSLETHQKYATGEYHYFYRAYTSGLVGFLTGQLPGLIGMVFQTLTIAVVVLFLKWQLLVIAVFFLPFYFIHTYLYRKKALELYEKNDQFQRKYSRTIFDNFAYFFLNKARGRTERRKRETQVCEGKRMRLDFEINRFSIWRGETKSSLDRLIIGSVSLYGSIAIIMGKMTLGSFSVIMLYFSQLIGIWGNWNNFMQNFERSFINLKKFFEVMDLEEELPEKKDARELKNIQGNFKIQNLAFQYPQRPLLFKNCSLEIQKGQWIGLVGPSGSGKTTFLQLLLRLRQPETGEIYLDGNNLKDLKINSLRRKTGLAFQEVFLYNDTIENNITLFSPAREKNEKLLAEAIEIAGVSEFLKDLPDGVKTNLGENSVKLSQGQRQRLSLARAIFGQPALLFLDEALSSVDLKMEAEIYRQLRESRKGLTTLIVTHRIHSVTDADLIIFFDKGLVFSGSHQELLKIPDYRDFFETAQAK